MFLPAATLNLSIEGISTRKASESWTIDAWKAVEVTTAAIALTGGARACGGESIDVMASVKGTALDVDLLIKALMPLRPYAIGSWSFVGGNRDEYKAFAVPQGTNTKLIVVDFCMDWDELVESAMAEIISWSVPSPPPTIMSNDPSDLSKYSKATDPAWPSRSVART